MAGNIYEVSDSTFEAQVVKASEPVLVDFWAAWCGPCLALAPTIEAVANQYAGRIKVCKLNVDDNPKTAAKFGIRSIPTILLFKEGKLIDQLVGNVPQGVINELLKKLM